MAFMLVLTAHASLALEDETGEILPSHGDMNCLVDSPFDPDADTMLTDIEFWYGVENAVDESNTFASAIESKIYHVSFSHTEETDTVTFLLTFYSSLDRLG
jgi:hypothetical protein